MSDPGDARSPTEAAWTMPIDRLAENTLELHVRRDGTSVAYGEVIRLWRDDRPFRTFFGAALAEAPWQAAFWETPPVTRSSLERPFSCVLVDAPTLARMSPERFVFDAALQEMGASGIATFPNLGGDALLVVPSARTEDAAYSHMLAFLRHAPEDQQDALWVHLGKAVEERLGEQPLWVSTSGLGVAWLHVRLDTVPKYYVHAPYRNALE